MPVACASQSVQRAPKPFASKKKKGEQIECSTPISAAVARLVVPLTTVRFPCAMQFGGIVALCGSNESDGGESAVAPGFGDLPGSFLLALPSYLDARSKKTWRLVCRKADQHVCQSMTALAWHGVKSSALPYTPMRGTKQQQQQQDTAGPSSLGFAARCHKLRQLRCHNLPCLTDLGSPPPSLEVLLLKDCCGVSDFSPLTQCTALRELQLSLPLKAVRRMESHSTDPAPLLSAITPLSRLQQLSLGLRRMQPAGAEAVAATLRAFPSLQQLALTHGDFSRAWTALAQALGSLGRLTQLRLSHCGIDPAGMLALAPTLRRLTELRELVLSHNQLGDDGVEALAPALPDLQQLTALHVNENDFTYNGAAVLSQVLPAIENNLALLNVHDNDLEEDGIALLRQAVPHCKLSW